MELIIQHATGIEILFICCLGSGALCVHNANKKNIRTLTHTCIHNYYHA